MKYKLFDLEIMTVGDPKTFNCSHKVGDGLVIKGENMSFKKGTEQISHYAIATLIPYIAAKQRTEQKEDWMTYETEIACPDPRCGARFQFKKLGQTTYSYSPKS